VWIEESAAFQTAQPINLPPSNPKLAMLTK
jgi:hypothetical protein